jgi:dolichol-phosphate mannosyltransferase
MNKGIVKEGVLGVLKLKWMSMFKNYRNRVKSISEISPSFQNEILVEGK